MYGGFLLTYFLILALSVPYFSFSLSEKDFYKKKSAFDQYQYLKDQKILEKTQAKRFFIQQNKNWLRQKDQQRAEAIRRFSREAEKRKAQILFQSFVQPYNSESYLKERWLTERRQERELRKKYPTPLDIHLFSKPLSIRKK